MKQTVLLTGANGFLGCNIARVLLARGYAVRALVRGEPNQATLGGLPLEIVRGDINDLSALRRAAEGCRFIIHAAADIRMCPARNAGMWRSNYFGTLHVIQVALEAQVERLVHVSTCNCFSPGPLEQPGDETCPYTDYRYGMDYMDSKYAAYLAVRLAVRQRGLRAVIVSPGFIFGRYDSRPGAGKLILTVYKGLFPGYIPGGKNVVAVQDVAEATVNALSKGRIGEAYILGGENRTYREIGEMICRAIGIKKRLIFIPRFIFLLLGIVLGAVAKISGKEPLISFKMARIGSTNQYYSSEKARRELDMPHTPVEQAMREAFEWFREEGYA